MPQWSYRRAEVREDVSLNLVKGWKLHVCEVTSGDSGKKYWIQILWDDKDHIILTTCQCSQGYFQIPVTGKPVCKHVEGYLEFKEERKK